MKMSKDLNFKENILTHWINNLVGTNNAFVFNLLINLVGGLLYSFKVFPSPYLLLLFGIVSPILFTLCLYSYIRNGSGMLLNEPLPIAFVSRSGNRVLMTFDICLIIGFALLIFFGPLDYFLFRSLQTLFFPCMLLVMLRVLYLSNMNETHDNDYE
jgi:hypothetical protein